MLFIREKRKVLKFIIGFMCIYELMIVLKSMEFIN